jgi:hypothetical protein
MLVGAQSHDGDAVFEQMENRLRLQSSKSSADIELWERGYGALCHLKKARPTGTCPAFTSSYLAFREKRTKSSIPHLHHHQPSSTIPSIPDVKNATSTRSHVQSLPRNYQLHL